MNRFLFIFLVFYLILSFDKARANEPIRYTGTPIQYSKFIPKEIACDFDKKGQQGSCVIKNYPNTATIGITTVAAKPKAEAVQIRLYMEVVCTKGKCLTPYGEPAGSVDSQQTSYWLVPTGFYLHSVNGKVRAYKAGNGPRAKEYPIRDVWVLPEYDDLPDGYYIPEESNRLTFNVYCNVANDCIFMGKEITYAGLSKYVPKRLSHQCDTRFCYDQNKMIIGLNPKHF